MSQNKTVCCAYKPLDNGIHEFIFKEASRAAVDELVTHITRILQTTPDDAPQTRYLIDNSQVEPVPLRYARTRLKTVDELRPPNRQPGRLAVLYDGTLLIIANSLLRIAFKNQMRFFKPAEREAAIAWLQEYS